MTQQLLLHSFRIPVVLKEAQRLISPPSLMQSLQDLSPGVNIYWSPTGAGKSLYLCEALRRHQFEGNAALLIDGEMPKKAWNIRSRRVNNKFHLYHQHLYQDWFASNLLNITYSESSRPFQVSKLLKELPMLKNPIIAFDHLDGLLQHRFSETLQFLRGLAFESTSSGSFKILVTITNVELAARLLLQRGTDELNLLSPSNLLDFKWKHEQVKEFIERDLMQNQLTQEYSMLTVLGVAAGTPGFLVKALPSIKKMHMWSRLTEMAEISHREWSRGADLLYYVLAQIQ